MASDTLDERVREALDRLLAERDLQLDAHPVSAVRSRVTRRRRRRRGGVAAAIAGVAVVVGSAIAISADGGNGGQDVDVVAPPVTGPVGPPGSIVSEPGGVERLPEPPLEIRGDAAVVWTGAEFVVWGGDVEAFNMGLPGDDRNYSDGAAFAPATGTWRQLSASPLPNNSEPPVGVMTNAGVLITRGRSTALWNPEDDTWRDLGDAPRPVNDLASNGPLAVSHSANAVLDVARGEWRELSAPPIRLDRPTTAWTGRELIVIGGPESAFTAAAIAYDFDTDGWRQLASPPTDLNATALSADWDGERVVVVNYDMTAATYDPATDSWDELPPVPARFYEWYPTVRSSNGVSAAFMARAVVVLTEADGWVPLPYGEIPFGSVATTRPGFRVDAGDGTLFVWSLDTDRGANTLTAVDLNRLVARSRRVQVGVGSIEVGESASLIDATYADLATGDEEVRAVIEQGDRSRCTVSSGYGTGAIEQPVEEIINNDGRPTPWFRDTAGRTWQTAPTTSDVFTIACDQANNARALANSASFGEQ